MTQHQNDVFTFVMGNVHYFMPSATVYAKNNFNFYLTNDFTIICPEASRHRTSIYLCSVCGTFMCCYDGAILQHCPLV